MEYADILLQKFAYYTYFVSFFIVDGMYLIQHISFGWNICRVYVYAGYLVDQWKYQMKMGSDFMLNSFKRKMTPTTSTMNHEV